MQGMCLTEYARISLCYECIIYRALYDNLTILYMVSSRKIRISKLISCIYSYLANSKYLAIFKVKKTSCDFKSLVCMGIEIYALKNGRH